MDHAAVVPRLMAGKLRLFFKHNQAQPWVTIQEFAGDCQTDDSPADNGNVIMILLRQHSNPPQRTHECAMSTPISLVTWSVPPCLVMSSSTNLRKAAVRSSLRVIGK